MTSGRRCAIRSTTAGDDTSMRWNEKRRSGCERASARLASDPARQVVDDVDVPALGEQAVDERRADEARAAGDHAFITGRLVTAPTLLALGRAPGRPRSACPTATVTSAPTSVYVGEHHVGLHDGVAADDRVVDGAVVRARARPSCSTADSSTAPCSTIAPRAEHRAAHARARLHARARPEQRRRQHRRARLDRRVALRPDALRELARARASAAGRRCPRSTSVCACEVLLGRADVEPVRVGAEAEQPARLLRAGAGTSRARPTR